MSANGANGSDREALLEEMLRLAGLADEVEAAFPKVSRGRPLPLSPGQERLWFLEQLRPGTAV
ncbi:hypothetical protein ACFQ08_01875, partial [Streptosporangium algeriense]